MKKLFWRYPQYPKKNKEVKRNSETLGFKKTVHRVTSRKQKLR